MEQLATSFEPFAWLANHNRSLLARMDGRGFDPDIELDPTLNGAEIHIHLADEVIVTYPQGSFPTAYAADYVDTTELLLKKVEKRFGHMIAKPMAQKFHHHFGLWYYHGDPLHPANLFSKKIFDAEDDLFNTIQHSNCQMGMTPTSPAAEVPRKRRGRCYGDRDPVLHKERAEIVAEMRRRKKAAGLAWAKIAAVMRGSSAYAAKMRGRTDATWIRYAKAGFSG